MQKSASDAAISGLLKERRLRDEEEKARREFQEDQIKQLLEKVMKMRALCRENTRELLRTKKMCHASEKELIEEKASVVAELKRVSDALQIEKERNENVERVMDY